jgi:hypothetical protein
MFLLFWWHLWICHGQSKDLDIGFSLCYLMEILRMLFTRCLSCLQVPGMPNLRIYALKRIFSLLSLDVIWQPCGGYGGRGGIVLGIAQRSPGGQQIKGPIKFLIPKNIFWTKSFDILSFEELYIVWCTSLVCNPMLRQYPSWYGSVLVRPHRMPTWCRSKAVDSSTYKYAPYVWDLMSPSANW